MEEFCVFSNTGKVHKYNNAPSVYCRFKSGSDNLHPLGKCKNYAHAQEKVKQKRIKLDKPISKCLLCFP